MKTIQISLSVVLFSIFLFSCEKTKDEIRSFEGVPVSTEIELDYLPLNVFDFPTPPIGLNLREAIDNKIGTNNTIDMVEDIKLSMMNLELLNADDHANFDFLDKVKIILKTDALEEKLVAWNESIEDGKTNIDLETTNDFIDNYAKSENLKIIIQYTNNDDVYNLKVKVNMKLDFKSKI